MALLNFQKPDKVIMIDSTDFEGKFEFRPLEPGYGLTVGNALRRVLLSSLEGFAITSVRVEGVDHEFSTIAGVVEDFTEIILNLKQVRFKRQIDEIDNETVTISVSDKEQLTAGDFQKFISGFQILNPDLVIANMEKSVNINMEITVEKGRGYVPAEENELPNAPVGTLAIDSIFNPVTKVTFDVSPVPGAKEPIEILTISVETDGSITPQDAISHASSVLIDHLKYVQAIASPEVLEVSEGISEEDLKIRSLLKLTIDEMELSVRSHNCLQAAGIKFIFEMVKKEEGEMLKYKNFGRKSLTELVEKLDEMGLHFGMDVDTYLKEPT
mgnify:CR=1 FL=1